MAKDITLKTRNGETRYPKTVTAIVYENGTGKTLQTIIDEMRQVDTQTDTRTQHFKADVNNLDTLKNKTDIGLYNYVGTGWRGSVSVCYDSADNVSQVALSSSTPSYNGNTLTWLSAQPCAMARTYTNGAWSHWEKVGAPVVNDLTTGGTDKALSAEMGKTLKEGLDALGPKCDHLDEQINGVDKYTKGAYLSRNNDVVTAEGWGYSDYVEVTGGSQITVNWGVIDTAMNILEYNSNKTKVEYWSQLKTATSKTFTAAANTRYVRFSFQDPLSAYVVCNGTMLYQALKSGFTANVLRGWILTESFSLVSCTRNADNSISAASVVWPDGVSGSLAITRNSAGSATSVAVMYGTDSYTITITRDSSDLVTATSITKN